MTGRDDVRNAVNHVENEYRRSWATIEALKRGDSSLDADDLMGYQTTLAGALFGLDELYRSLCQEERQLISRKSEQNKDWTKARLRIVHDHQDTLRHAIAIGKVLGDCFAWMFYSQDREMLDHHMAHGRQFHTPPGLGGLTERSFIDRVRVIGRYIVLYHGITDMLRVGDISLYDPETRRVAALGELKANSREGDVISLELSLIASKGTPETIFQVPVVVSSETIERPQRPPQMEARLKRQMHEMASAFHASDPDASLSLVTSKRVGDLESLHAALGTRRWACKKIGDGYLLIAIRPKGKSLATRLTNGSVPDLDGLVEETRHILDTNTDENILLTGPVLTPVPRSEPQPGTIPFTWWPLDHALLRAIVFHEIQLVSIYNPLFLIRKLEQAGFAATFDPESKTVNLQRTLGDGRRMEFHGFGYYQRLIVERLVPEETIVEMLVQIAEDTVARGLDNSRTEIRYHEHEGSAPTEDLSSASRG